MDNNDKEIYKIRKILKELKNKRGSHTELISLYIPYNRKMSDVKNYLHKEQVESKNIKLNVVTFPISDIVAIASNFFNF